ncbi:MAG: protease inhibitor I42 family protein [Hyphomonadaceae bacterium]|nr:protease inhibitor I42 family protein [Hyphomonadaceae bacterium]MCA8887182.1 protease inhibitor I42 family protein [Hyphomonadaceae bacterium]
MIRPVLFVAAIALAACTAGQETKQETTVASNAVAAPTPDDVTIRITQEQDGQTVNVAVNQRFAIELVGVPTAGYVWAPAQVPAFIARSGEATGNTTRDQSQPGFTGGNHWEVTMFSATAAGTGEIVMEQRRPWETNEPASQTFRVTIHAQ